MKSKISRCWTSRLIITEKICDVLFKLQHAQNSPHVDVHGDNIKPYVGPETFEWFRVPTQSAEIVPFLDLKSFEMKMSAQVFSLEVSERSMNVTSVECSRDVHQSQKLFGRQIKLE